MLFTTGFPYALMIEHNNTFNVLNREYEPVSDDSIIKLSEDAIYQLKNRCHNDYNYIWLYTDATDPRSSIDGFKEYFEKLNIVLSDIYETNT